MVLYRHSDQIIMHSAFDVAFANIKLSNIPPARREVKLEEKNERKLNLSSLFFCTLLLVIFVVSVYYRLQYVGTIVNIFIIEAVTALTSVVENKGIRMHMAVMASCACVGVFAWRDKPMQQELLSYSIYVGMCVVLLMKCYLVPNYRPLDAMLVICSVLAIASALVMRHVIQQLLLVQMAEMCLLMLCAGTYWLMHVRMV